MKCNSYFFEVMSNKTRWKIILSLYDKEKCVKEICEDTKEEQSKISHNLKILSTCKFVYSKKEGRTKTYYLNKKTMKPLLDIVQKHMHEFCKNKCICKK